LVPLLDLLPAMCRSMASRSAGTYLLADSSALIPRFVRPPNGERSRTSRRDLLADLSAVNYLLAETLIVKHILEA
jgi:hypothetical protein